MRCLGKSESESAVALVVIHPSGSRWECKALTPSTVNLTNLIIRVTKLYRLCIQYTLRVMIEVGSTDSVGGPLHASLPK